MTHRRQCTAAFNAQAGRARLSGAKRRAELRRAQPRASAGRAAWKARCRARAAALFTSPAPRDPQEAPRVAALGRRVGRLPLEPALRKPAPSLSPTRPKRRGRAARGPVRPRRSTPAAGGWEPHGAARSLGATLAVPCPGKPPSSGWRGRGPPLATGGSRRDGDANLSRSTPRAWHAAGALWGCGGQPRGAARGQRPATLPTPRARGDEGAPRSGRGWGPDRWACEGGARAVGMALYPRRRGGGQRRRQLDQ